MTSLAGRTRTGCWIEMTGRNILVSFPTNSSRWWGPRPGREIIAGGTSTCCQAPRLAEPRFGEDAP